MRHPKLRRLHGLLPILSILICTWTAFSADVATGTWDCAAKGLPDGDVQFTLELTQSGDSLTGTLNAEGGSVEISDGKIKGDKLEFTVIAPSARYTVAGTMSGKKIAGTWKDDGGNGGNWEGQKQPSK